MADADDARPLIVHVIHRLDVGGLENGLVNLVNRLPADDFRHAIVCLTDYSDFHRRIRRPDVGLYALGKREGKDPACYLRLWRLLRRLRPTIVHTRNLAALDALVVAWLAGVPLRVHGEHGWDTYDLHGRNRKYRLLRRLCRPLVHRYVALSRDLEHWLLDWVGVAPARLSRICNGVDDERFHPRRGRADRERLPVAFRDKLVIGWVGRMEAVKAAEHLAGAFVQLLERHSEAGRQLRLVMVGEGSRRPEVERILETGQVRDLAWLPGAREDVPELLRAMDLFVLPSLNEGISNTILEAMASGLPVVATAVGGNPELVAEGLTGALVPAGDKAALVRALERYWQHPELRRRQGEEGRKQVERSYSLDAMVQAYGTLYRRLLAGRDGNALGSAGPVAGDRGKT